LPLCALFIHGVIFFHLLPIREHVYDTFSKNMLSELEVQELAFHVCHGLFYHPNPAINRFLKIASVNEISIRGAGVSSEESCLMRDGVGTWDWFVLQYHVSLDSAIDMY